MDRVEKYAKFLLRGQVTCLCSKEHSHFDILETARLMDRYLQRGWYTKLCDMQITRYDGFKNKIHDFAINLCK